MGHTKTLRKKQKENNEQNKGSLTVFFVVIFLSIILLTGSLVDFSRMMVAEHRVDTAIKASTKSMLADYDAELIGRYGIFGIEETDKDNSFEAYLTQNLEFSSNSFIDYELENNLTDTPSVTFSENLAENDNLKEQIKEYMKYKAPINTGVKAATRALNVISGLLNSKEAANSEDVNSSPFLGDSLEDMGKIKSVNNLDDASTSLENERKRQENTKDVASGIIQDKLAEVAEDEMQHIADESLASEDDLNTYKKAKDSLKIMTEQKDEYDRLQRKIDNLSGDKKGEKKRELKNKQNQAKQKYDEAYNDLYEAMNDSGKEKIGDLSKTKDDFQNIANKITAINVELPIKETGKSRQVSYEEGETSAKEMYSSACTLKDNLNGLNLDNLVSSSYDKYIAVEYIMDRFTYATSANDGDNSFFKYGEAEYALWGNSNQAVNLITVLSEIVIFCYLINVFDLYFCGIPLFPAALIAAIPYTLYSVYELYSGGVYVPFGLKITNETVEKLISLSYSDMLYIQMLLFSNADDLYTRIGNIISANITGGDGLGKYKTQVNTHADVSINLMFLPMLPIEQLAPKAFRNNRYVFSKDYSYAYQYK